MLDLAFLDDPSVQRVLASAGVLLGVVGLVLTVVFYERGRRSKDPRWALRNANIVDAHVSAIPKLDCLYDDEHIQTLSIARLMFWNHGSETIDGSDLRTTNPLRIEAVGEARILDATILGRNGTSNNFEIEIEDAGRRLRMSFDYLDRGHGAVIQIAHTGTSNASLQTVGDIKGVRRIKKVRVAFGTWLPFPTPARFDMRFRPSTRRRVISVFWLLFGSVYAVTAALFLVSATRRSPLDFVLGLFAFAFVAIAVRRCAHYWFGGPPPGLDRFEGIMLRE